MSAEKTKELLSQFTAAPFHISEPHPDDPVRREAPDWFVSYTDASYVSKVPYVQRAWKSKGEIILESTDLGDTIDWIESAYGEEAAAESLDINYSNFTNKEFQIDFAKRYPLIHQRIQTYETIAVGISRTQKVHLELGHSGSKGIVTFALRARFRADSKSVAKQVEANVKALKDAYEQIMQV